MRVNHSCVAAGEVIQAGYKISAFIISVALAGDFFCSCLVTKI